MSDRLKYLEKQADDKAEAEDSTLELYLSLIAICAAVLYKIW